MDEKIQSHLSPGELSDHDKAMTQLNSNKDEFETPPEELAGVKPNEFRIAREKAQAFIDSLDNWQRDILSDPTFMRSVLANTILSSEISDIRLAHLEEEYKDKTELDRYEQRNIDGAREASSDENHKRMTAAFLIDILEGNNLTDAIAKDIRIRQYITHHTKNTGTHMVMAREGQLGPEKQEEAERQRGLRLEDFIEENFPTTLQLYSKILTEDELDQAKEKAIARANIIEEGLKNKAEETEAQTPEITAEQKVEIDRKREKLLTGDKFAYRFVNFNEYLKMMQFEQTPRQLETATETMEDFLSGGEMGHLVWTRLNHKPGDSLWLWSSAADAKTQWHEAANAINEIASIYRGYRELWKEIHEKGGSRQEARNILINRLKGEAAYYVNFIYGNTPQWKEMKANGTLPEKHHYTVTRGWEHEGQEYDLYRSDRADQNDLPFDQNAKLLDHPIEVLEDEHRIRLNDLMAKDPSNFSKSDIKFLMRFAKGYGVFGFTDRINDPNLQSGDSMIPYELVEIWSGDVSETDINSWNDSMGFTAIPKGTPISEMLGVIAVSQYDNDYLREISEKMAVASKDNPGKAHVVIDPKFFEYFPDQGTDFMPEY